MTPKVDTFEHDIVDEIKRREASLAEISAASNDVGNTDVELPKKPPILVIATGTFLVLCLIGFGALGYFYYTDSLLPPSSQSVPIGTSDIPKTTTDLQKISPVLATEIGRFVTRVEKKDRGYVLTINDYSSVFAYMMRNESAYIDELAPLFAASSSMIVATTTLETRTPTQVATTTSTPPVATSSSSTTTPKTNSTTKTATSSTVIVITTTTPAVPKTVTLPSSGFSDVTIANQNMRVWTSGNRVVVYAFVGNTTVLISNSTDGILTLKSAILR